MKIIKDTSPAHIRIKNRSLKSLENFTTPFSNLIIILNFSMKGRSFAIYGTMYRFKSGICSIMSHKQYFNSAIGTK